MRFWPRAVWEAHAAQGHPSADSTTRTRSAPGWPTLPSIQRVISPVTPTAGRAEFEASLGTRRNPSFLAPLAHIIDPGGPSGRIGGLVNSAPPEPAGHSDAARQVGLIQRWPQRLPNDPVITPSIETDQWESPTITVDPTPAAAPSEPQQESSDRPPNGMAVQRRPVETADVPVEAPSTVPLTSQAGLRPVPSPAPIPAAIPEASAHFPGRRLALHSDATTVQRSLIIAPAPEPVFRALPILSRMAEPAVSAGASTAPDAASEAGDEPGPIPVSAATGPAATGPAATGAAATVPAAPPEGLLPEAALPLPAATPEDATPVPAVREPERVAPLTSQRSDIGPRLSAQRSAIGDDISDDDRRPDSSVEATALPATRSIQPPATTPRPAVEVQRSEASAPATDRPALTPSARQPRKLGFGAPIEQPPATAAVVETISLQEWASARDAAPSMQRFAATAGADPSDGTPVRADRENSESAVLLGDRPSLLDPPLTSVVDPVAQRGEESDSVTVATATPAHAGARVFHPPRIPPAPVQRAVTTGLPAGAIMTTLQRLPIGGSQDALRRGEVPPSEGPTSQGGRAAEWSTRQATLRTIDDLPAPGTATVVQRLVGAAGPSPLHVPTPGSTGWPAAWPDGTVTLPSRPGLPTLDVPQSSPPQSTHHIVQRSARAAGSAGPWGAGQTTFAPRILRATDTVGADLGPPAMDAGGIAVAAGIAQRETDGTVIFNMAIPADPSPDAPTIQRAVEVEEMTVDSTAAGTAGSSTSEAAAHTPSTTVPTAGDAPAPAGAAAPNIDDLARRLYDPLAARLKAELRLDRERAGLVTDLRSR